MDVDANDARMRGTVEFIQRELLYEGLVQRYRTAFGARARAAYWATPHFGLFVAAGGNAGLRRSAPHDR